MKIKDGFILREVAGNYIVVAVSSAVKNFNVAITLNETGAFLFKELGNDVTEEQLVSSLLGEYEVSEETAKKDVKAFIEKLQKANLLK